MIVKVAPRVGELCLKMMVNECDSFSCFHQPSICSPSALPSIRATWFPITLPALVWMSCREGPSVWFQAFYEAFSRFPRAVLQILGIADRPFIPGNLGPGPAYLVSHFCSDFLKPKSLTSPFPLQARWLRLVSRGAFVQWRAFPDPYFSLPSWTFISSHSWLDVGNYFRNWAAVCSSLLLHLHFHFERWLLTFDMQKSTRWPLIVIRQQHETWKSINANTEVCVIQWGIQSRTKK